MCALLPRHKKAAYLRYYPGLSDLNYADIVRFESKLGADGLQKLEADFVNTPGLAAAFKNNPALVNGWKIVDDAAEAGVCSFDGSMEVHANRGMVSIRDLQAGIDSVLAKDEETGRIEYKLVTDVYSNIYDRQVLISTVNDATGEKQTVISNEIHPVFSIPITPSTAVSSEGHNYGGDIEGGQWIDAANLSIGDKLLNADNGYSTLYDIEIINTRFRAFNLTISDFHTYFVSAPGSSTAYWVHNSCLIDGVSNILRNDTKVLEWISKQGDNIPQSAVDDLLIQIDKPIKEILEDAQGRLTFVLDRPAAIFELVVQLFTTLRSFQSA